MRRTSPLGHLVLLAALVALVLASLVVVSLAVVPPPTPSGTTAPAGRTPAPPSPSIAPAPTESSASADGQPSLPPEAVGLADLLAILPIAPERRAGYDRSLFTHWTDADGDGCNTRKEVLIEEAVVAPTIGASCSLTGGRWVSRYDGMVLFDPEGLDIDHVVALAEAWDSGAFSWTPERRQRFANDLGVEWSLIAVSAQSNRSKSDQDPADWLPPRADDLCPFLSAWIAVKVRWGLSVDVRERDALVDLIVACPGVQVMVVVAEPAVEAEPPWTPSVSVTAGCDPAYPTVCIPPSPPDLDCGDIAFRRFVVLTPDPHRFDADHDGVGCEG